VGSLPGSELLDREALRDPALAAEFRARWEQAGAAVVASASGVANPTSGDVSGPVVRVRDIHGGASGLPPCELVADAAGEVGRVEAEVVRRAVGKPVRVPYRRSGDVVSLWRPSRRLRSGSR
jgi:hypothetical protein